MAQEQLEGLALWTFEKDILNNSWITDILKKSISNNFNYENEFNI